VSGTPHPIKMLLGIQLGTIDEFARAKLLLPPNPDRVGITGMVMKAMGAGELLTLDRKVF
jgi:hypothetical protein